MKSEPPEPMPYFTVVIVNWNGGSYVQGALDSLGSQTFRDFEVFLVDNASSDGSVDKLDTAALPHFTLMAQDRNLGFAKGNNVAAKAGSGDWLVLLNPDAEAATDWLQTLRDAILANPGTHMFASAQYNLLQPEELDGVGDCYLGFGFPWRGGFGHPASSLPGPGECFSPCGAGAVYHRGTFLAHDGFDERFFCFCEDVDIGYRLRLAGEKCLFLPNAIIHHAGGGLAGRRSPFADYHGMRNRLWCYAKNTPGLLLIATLPFHVAITAALLIRNAVGGRFAASWKGLWDGILGLRSVRRGKRFSPPVRVVTLSRLCRAMAWNPLLFLKRQPDVK
ncbi:MAG: glycosyltransferase family 2 protein [Pseudomonadota bacterium]